MMILTETSNTDDSSSGRRHVTSHFIYMHIDIAYLLTIFYDRTVAASTSYMSSCRRRWQCNTQNVSVL